MSFRLRSHARGRGRGEKIQGEKEGEWERKREEKMNVMGNEEIEERLQSERGGRNI